MNKSMKDGMLKLIMLVLLIMMLSTTVLAIRSQKAEDLLDKTNDLIKLAEDQEAKLRGDTWYMVKRTLWGGDGAEVVLKLGGWLIGGVLALIKLIAMGTKKTFGGVIRAAMRGMPKGYRWLRRKGAALWARLFKRQREIHDKTKALLADAKKEKQTFDNLKIVLEKLYVDMHKIDTVGAMISEVEKAEHDKNVREHLNTLMKHNKAEEDDAKAILTIISVSLKEIDEEIRPNIDEEMKDFTEKAKHTDRIGDELETILNLENIEITNLAGIRDALEKVALVFKDFIEKSETIKKGLETQIAGLEEKGDPNFKERQAKLIVLKNSLVTLNSLYMEKEQWLRQAVETIKKLFETSGAAMPGEKTLTKVDDDSAHVEVLYLESPGTISHEGQIVDKIILNKTFNKESEKGYLIGPGTKSEIRLDSGEKINERLGTALIYKRDESYRIGPAPGYGGQIFAHKSGGFEVIEGEIKLESGTLFHLGPEAKDNTSMFRFDLETIPTDDQTPFTFVNVYLKHKDRPAKSVSQHAVLIPKINDDFDVRLTQGGHKVTKFILYADNLVGGKGAPNIDVSVNIAGADADIMPFELHLHEGSYYISKHDPVTHAKIDGRKEMMEPGKEYELGHKKCLFIFKMDEVVDKENSMQDNMTIELRSKDTASIGGTKEIGVLQPIDGTVEVDGKSSSFIPITKSAISFGKEGDDVVISLTTGHLDSQVHKGHFRIMQSADSYRVFDNKTDALFINGAHLTRPHDLEDNDLIMLFGSNVSFRFKKVPVSADTWKKCKVSFDR